MDDEVKIGDAVVFGDTHGVERPALVTNVFGSWKNAVNEVQKPSINLVVVSLDATKSDQYGRQIEHGTSVPHKQNQSAPGNFWREA